MGGNALNSNLTRRYSSQEYYALEKEVVDILESHFNTVLTIPTYRKKESFGDMDIIVSEYNGVPPVRSILKYLFNWNECVQNGGVYSFDYKNFQIDLILTPKEIAYTSRNFFSWSDLGSIMGRVYHKMGLKYGHEGLRYIYRKNTTHVVADITVSTDTEKILTFGGYDYKKWAAGFDTLDDIFNYAISTPYFNKDIFAFENLNHQNRTRNRKRETYKKFVEWLANKDLPQFEFNEDKDFYLPTIFAAFSDFKPKYDEATYKFEQHRVYQSKFNGQLVQDLTGLTGKCLGDRIIKIKKSKENFEEYILGATQDQINKFILENKE